MKIEFKRIRFCSGKPARRMTIPQVSNLSMFLLQKPVKIMGFKIIFIRLHYTLGTDFSTFLPTEVVVVQIYPSKLPPMLSLESVQNHLNYLKSIKQMQMLGSDGNSQEPEQRPLL
jgi:hypothetical protein